MIKNIFSFFLVGWFFVACNNPQKIELNSDVLTVDSIDIKEKRTSVLGDTLPIVESQQLLKIDTDYYTVYIKSKKTQVVDVDKFQLSLFTRLKSGQDQFKYYYIPFNISESYKTFLILEDYESESAVWLANYTSDMKFTDALEVYYDNAEGCWLTTSEINKSQKTVKLTVYDCYANPEKTSKEVIITPGGKFKK